MLCNPQRPMTTSASRPQQSRSFEASGKRSVSPSAALCSRTSLTATSTKLSDGAIKREFIITGVYHHGSTTAGAYKDIETFPEHVVTAYRYIYADSLRTVWYVTTGIAATGLVVSSLVRNESMDRGGQSKQVFNNERQEKKVGDVYKYLDTGSTGAGRPKGYNQR